MYIKLSNGSAVINKNNIYIYIYIYIYILFNYIVNIKKEKGKNIQK